MATFGETFGPNSTAGSFLIWNLLSQLTGAALAPALLDISTAANTLDPVAPLTPEQLATAVARTILDADAAADEAGKSGIGPGRFAQLIKLAQQPPALGLIIAGYQRGIIGDGDRASGGLTLQAALADMGINPQWENVIRDLTVNIPTAEAVLNAWLEGQITEGDARPRLLAAGMDPTWIQTAYDSEGQAPTPVQALELWNRGIIPESGTGPESVSYEQAFLEGPWRNKWLDPFKALRFYLPPPRTVTALIREGSITPAQGAQYLAAQGLDPTLQAIYLSAASHTTTAAQRELTQAQIIDLYESELVTHDQAVADLVAARFSTPDANLLLALADRKKAAAATKTAVARLRSLFLAGSQDANASLAGLRALGLTDAQSSNLLATWQLEQGHATRTLTESQIVAAWFYQLFSDDAATNQQAALAKLVGIGYTADDARILLEVRNKGKLA